MKKKITYSMTAKERKERRRAEEEKKRSKNRTSGAVQRDMSDGVASADSASASGATSAKQKIWLPVTCIVLACVIILTAVILLVVVPRSNSKYPRAVITLGDGRELTLTIWEEESPIAATNFMFLADIGFFDKNIIYDVQPEKNYMRFGAYTGYSSSLSKYNDKDFIDSIPRKKFNIVNVDDRYKDDAQSNKFGYRLRKDTGGNAGRYGEKYVISFNNSNAADFVINLGENNTNFTDSNGKNSLNNSLVAFGAFEDEKSQRILDELYGYKKNYNTGLGDGVVGTETPIVIRSIKLYNMNKKKWRDFEFVSYMKTALNGSTAFSGWTD